MEIVSVKELTDADGSFGGYLLNGTISVPNDEKNRHYRMIQRWITEGNTPETPA